MSDVWSITSFILFTALVGAASWWATRRSALGQAQSYFLAGRGLGPWVIAGSLMLTNISTEQMIGLNGSAYLYGASVMAWEVVGAIALVLMATLFLPRYLRQNITTVQQYLRARFGDRMQAFVSFWFIILIVTTTLPFILATGSLALVELLDIGPRLGLSHRQAVLGLVFLIGTLGGIYSIFGGLKAIAVSDALNGLGLLIDSDIWVGCDWRR